jgi:hypothetical protein
MYMRNQYGIKLTEWLSKYLLTEVRPWIYQYAQAFVALHYSRSTQTFIVRIRTLTNLAGASDSRNSY